MKMAILLREYWDSLRKLREGGAMAIECVTFLVTPPKTGTANIAEV
jgi:hypothetical protein